MAFSASGTDYRGDQYSRDRASDQVTRAEDNLGRKRKQDRIKESGKRSGLQKLLSAGTRAGIAYATGGASEALGFGGEVDNVMLGTDSEGNAVRNEYGAIVGAGAGNMIGRNLDRQATDLRQDLNNDQVGITNTGSELIVTMPQDILFALDSASVRSGLRRDLRVVANNLRAYPNSTIKILGHTDNTGSGSYNESLSQRRADAVANILMNNGVQPVRLRTVGRGEDDPIANNLTAEGRAQNRRVEIIIRPSS